MSRLFQLPRLENFANCPSCPVYSSAPFIRDIGVGGLIKPKLLKIFAKNSFIFCVVITFMDFFWATLRLQQDSKMAAIQYRPSISSEEKRSLLYLLDRLVQEAEKANLTYFMYGGTLLGSYRHHGMILWDDDFDIICDHSQKDRLIQVINNMGPVFDLWHQDGPNIAKLFYRQTSHFIHKPYSYPFIDIFFFLSNDTHIWDGSPKYVNVKYSKSDVFPLTRRPFEDWMLPAPCDTEAFLKKLYDVTQCVTRYYSHRWDFVIPYAMTKVESCEKLHHYIPFVNRTILDNGTALEYVTIDENRNKTLVYIDPCPCDAK